MPSTRPTASVNTGRGSALASTDPNKGKSTMPTRSASLAPPPSLLGEVPRSIMLRSECSELPRLKPNQVGVSVDEGGDAGRGDAQALDVGDEALATRRIAFHFDRLHTYLGVVACELGNKRLGVLAVRAADAPVEEQRSHRGWRDLVTFELARDNSAYLTL